MITRKQLSIGDIYRFAGQHLLWLIPWMTVVPALYYFTQWDFIRIPWLPLSLIGTAVAFYVGFKNNQSYDRLWEARKIWGAMVNDSRKLATMIKQFRAGASADNTGHDKIRKEIVFRHIAYLYQLREQLLKPTRWEHVQLPWIYGRFNQRRRDKYFNKFKEEHEQLDTRPYLSADEKQAIARYTNKATQLLDRQTAAVQGLFESNLINSMQQVNLQAVLNGFYEEQGRAERIKNFPFPRQYASLSFVFVCLFVFLLPFGIVSEFAKLGEGMIWLSVPVGVIIGFVYVMMELIGDYSENPFEGLHNDIPMLAICRTIEIDLLEMIGETAIPAPVQPKNNILL
ncbi:bestrophin family protein [Paraflavitalea pollutisoli]|uniref:bestrophin family protein n=1 Tax=Paraflavitalea pollutisoli TaxID=3034143 RepID=UPI0023EAF461|nr:bestrophin family ion channel [Paraflavitalea sp. H1-2-19X]